MFGHFLRLIFNISCYRKIKRVGVDGPDFRTERPKLAEDCLSISCDGAPLWALSRRWQTESERLFSP
jgi:hypothetical protein